MMGDKPLQPAAHSFQRLVTGQSAEIPASHCQVSRVGELGQLKFATLKFRHYFPDFGFVCVGDSRHTGSSFCCKKKSPARKLRTGVVFSKIQTTRLSGSCKGSSEVIPSRVLDIQINLQSKICNSDGSRSPPPVFANSF
jgi:hypothetical protein